MCTQSNSPKVQQGPNLRAAIAQLPKSGRGRLTRDGLKGATAGTVASAINNRLVNDIPQIVDVIVHAAAAQDDGFVSSVQVGMQVLARDLDDEMKELGSLLWAIWADERGMDVPERRS
ncbi:MAG: hypothetical protein WD423_06075 [Rhodothermales bacterium]